jgi:hypothetical protein
VHQSSAAVHRSAASDTIRDFPSNTADKAFRGFLAQIEPQHGNARLDDLCVPTEESLPKCARAAPPMRRSVGGFCAGYCDGQRW